MQLAERSLAQHAEAARAPAAVAGACDTARVTPAVVSPQLAELLQWYTAAFRDPLMLQPPEWFKAFIYCEAFLQLPFFPVAGYAFLKGWCETGVGTCPTQQFCVCAAENIYLSV